MKYDIKPYDTGEKMKGFYIWNKPTFFVKKDDERYETMIKEKKETGMTSDETWDLKTNIAVFLVPRLKFFKEKQMNVGGYPGCFDSVEEWHKVLDKMIFAFEARLKDEFDVPEKYFEKYSKYDEERNLKAQDDYWNDVAEGTRLFAEYYGCLWW